MVPHELRYHPNVWGGGGALKRSQTLCGDGGKVRCRGWLWCISSMAPRMTDTDADRRREGAVRIVVEFT